MNRRALLMGTVAALALTSGGLGAAMAAVAAPVPRFEGMVGYGLDALEDVTADGHRLNELLVVELTQREHQLALARNTLLRGIGVREMAQIDAVMDYLTGNDMLRIVADERGRPDNWHWRYVTTAA